LVLAYSENPTDFPLVRSIFSKLVARTRNYPYTNTLPIITEMKYQIKFFRKIRQNLLSEGKIGKYLKYAFGEIILVVIGILIALSF